MKKLVFTALLASLAINTTYAALKNTGTMRAEECNLRFPIVDNTGTVEGLKTLTLTCKQLTGNGLLKGPKIEVNAFYCDFTGTIDCSEECILTTNTAQSDLKFQLKGTGKLTVKKPQQ